MAIVLPLHRARLDPIAPQADGSRVGNNRSSKSKCTRPLRWLSERVASGARMLDDGRAFPLYPGLGTHFVNIWVGTPPQRQSVIVDTGSPLTAFPCTPGCTESRCGKHTDPYFDLSRSSTAKPLTCKDCQSQCLNNRCEITQLYTEGSAWVAFQLRDRLWFGSPGPSTDVAKANEYAVDFQFGCQTKLSGLFVPQWENGIMGMAAGDTNVVVQLKRQSKVPKAVFSLCFSDDGGTMSMGGLVNDFHHTPISYVPLHQSSNGWYLVDVSSIQLAGQKLRVEETAALLDSGTTDTHLLQDHAQAFKRIFHTMTGRQYVPDRQYTLLRYELTDLPSLTFQLSSELTLHMPPIKYMEPQGKNVYIPRVYFTEKSMAVLGGNLFKGYDIIYDLEEHRIGFAQALCSFSNHERRRHCQCPTASKPDKSDVGHEKSKGRSDTQVCTVDGRTYQSICDAHCLGQKVLWQGRCPVGLTESCRDALFSDHEGCRELATMLLHDSHRTSNTADICTSPCWNSAAGACRGMALPGSTLADTLRQEYCTQRENGEYCRDLPRPTSSWTCSELQGLGCCYEALLLTIDDAERRQVETMQCAPPNKQGCNTGLSVLTGYPKSSGSWHIVARLSYYPLGWLRSSRARQSTYIGIAIFALIAVTIVLIIVGASLRALSRKVINRLSRKERAHSGVMPQLVVCARGTRSWEVSAASLRKVPGRMGGPGRLSTLSEEGLGLMDEIEEMAGA